MTTDEIRWNGALADVEDSELCSLAASGDGRALEVLYDRYARIVMSFATRMLLDPAAAEELTQEVFFRAWKQAGAYSASRGTYATWLLSITHNMAIDEIRKRQRRPQRADSEDPMARMANVVDTDRPVDEHAWLGMLRDEVKDALGILPESQRRPIELAYFRGLTQREVAETLGVPLGTIKTRMRLGMRKLRDQLEARKVEMT
ncbi:MAG TPA: sigma-70 family RNA polymerase sigma factor [Thermomicrobiales bacterium]|nr:sigma-70 family RNA polymerase sigma factor [Thermomicrobiales bacterium]